MKRLIIGITGASGIIYAIRLLEVLRSMPVETHLVVTKAGQLTRAYETNISLAELKDMADFYHPVHDIASPLASGSFQTMGMVIIPCSMNTLSEVAHGLSSHLLTRAADVVLKERRRLVIVPREAPLHLKHLENMMDVTKNGGIIFPPTPAFYQKPSSIEALVDDTLGRILDLFAIEHGLVKPWSKNGI